MHIEEIFFRLNRKRRGRDEKINSFPTSSRFTGHLAGHSLCRGNSPGAHYYSGTCAGDFARTSTASNHFRRAGTNHGQTSAYFYSASAGYNHRPAGSS